MPVYSLRHHPADLDATLGEIRSLVDIYATKQALPATVVAVLKDLCFLMEEIELCQYEGHGSDHHDIPWRAAHLILLCMCIERAGLRDGSARLLASHLLEHLGISFACAAHLALVRLQALLQEQDMVHVDTCMLVLLMKRHLAQH